MSGSISRSASGSYAGSVASSRSSASCRARVDRNNQEGAGEDLFDSTSPLENSIFGVLYTLRKENNETRVRIRWVLLKILLDAWQLVTIVIAPQTQGWSIKADGWAWTAVSVLTFNWLGKLSYGWYLVFLYVMVGLLGLHVGLCVWVAWCFKEQKFAVLWPIKLLRLYSSVFFQAFDVAALHLLELGFTCRYTGYEDFRFHLNLFTEYSCSSTPHVMHAVVSGVSFGLFVAIALFSNMAEVEVNLLSRRLFALGHSGPVVIAFAFKVLLTLVRVFIGWPRVQACLYLAFSLAYTWQFIRWSPHLVNWVNHFRSGVSVAIVWCSAVLMLLVFHPGVKEQWMKQWRNIMTLLLLLGLGPAFAVGALMSWAFIRRMTNITLYELKNAKPGAPLNAVCTSIDDPKDVEIVARCCRVWKDRYTVDPVATEKAQQVVQAGMAMFPTSAYMVLLQANFMIDVLGVSQSGSRRIEDSRKLDPGLMSRYIMFIRQHEASQQAAGSYANGGASMDLLAYVEYQRKQRMVVRLHREALQAMCNFWKILDASKVSFTHLSKALGKIESSVSQAQTAYRVVLENYGNNPKLVRLYGKFLLTIKNDPWRSSEYFTEADRLQEMQNGDGGGGPLLPDGTPLGRMDEIATAVLVINVNGDVQMANRHAHTLFGYKRGTLEAKPMATLLAPHYSRWLSDHLAYLAGRSEMVVYSSAQEHHPQAPLLPPPQRQGDGGASGGQTASSETVVGMHAERLAFPMKLALRKASGVGEDSTFIAMMEILPPVKGVASLWVAQNGIIVACDPQFVLSFGWKSHEVNGVPLPALLAFQDSAASIDATSQVERTYQQQQQATTAAPSITSPSSDAVNRLLRLARCRDKAYVEGVPCLMIHKYNVVPIRCTASIIDTDMLDTSVYEIKCALTDAAASQEMLVVNRRGSILHASTDVVTHLTSLINGGSGGLQASTSAAAAAAADVGSAFLGPNREGPSNSLLLTNVGSTVVTMATRIGGVGAAGSALVGVDQLERFALCDFIPSPWKEMHYKYLRGTTPLTPASRNPWTCRRDGMPGLTFELRSISSSRSLFMHVSVTTTENAGELNHIIRMSSSSVDTAVSERRLRLQTSHDGFISSVEDSPAARLLGLDCSQLNGRALWEIIDWSPYVDSGCLPRAGPLMFTALVKREILEPGMSWRVQVSSSSKAIRGGELSEMMALARAAKHKAAVLQVHIEIPSDTDKDAGDGDDPKVFIDLWLLSAVSGVLEVDGVGRIRAVLEEHTRPAGLLFGVSTHSLVGSILGEYVAMPQGRNKPADLLSNSLKKSSLKATTVESSAKVGPLHVLQAAHSDGQPNAVDVQVVCKTGSNTNMYVILRSHTAPMKPTAGGAAAVLIPPASLGATAPNISCNGFKNISHDDDAPASAAVSKLVSSSSERVLAAFPVPDAGQKPSLELSATTGGVFGISTPPEKPLQRRASGKTSAGTPPDSSEPMIAAVPPPSSSPFDQPSFPPLPPPPDGLEGLRDGLPVPAVILSTAAAGANKAPLAATLLSGRGKLGNIVKSIRQGSQPFSDRVSPGNGSGANRVVSRLKQRAATSPMATAACLDNGEGGASEAENRQREPPFSETVLKGAQVEAPGLPAAADIESVSGDDDDDDDDEAVNMALGSGKERISTWVASQGSYYQNSVLADEGDKSGDSSKRPVRGEDLPNIDTMLGSVDLKALLRRGVQGGGDDDDDPTVKPVNPSNESQEAAPGSWAWRRGDAPLSSLPIDDDAASEGGQSAMSAQSGEGGADYKRGKRFRKLMKLMDSGQAQQVQQRYRLHALITVALLAAVHIVCFALTINAVSTKRFSMLQLGRSGQAQRYMHQIMTDVRSLDMISKNRTHANLYNRTAADVEFFINRIAKATDEVQVRFREILDSHHTSSANVHALLFYTTRKVWNGYEDDGTDKYTNITIWDFSTRFYAMAKDVEQHGKSWVENHVDIAKNTTAGQFLLKSGPDLWKASRQILDALLYVAVDDARWIDNLQIAFLCVEGAAITSVAACYLAYLLKSVSAQRYKLYSTFMHIPLGLTRALASQTTTLTVDEGEDDDTDDDADDKTHLHDEQELGGDVAVVKQKRRAMLAVSDTAVGPLNRDPSSGYGNFLSRELSLTSPKSGVDMDGVSLGGGLHSRKNRSFRARSSSGHPKSPTNVSSDSRGKRARGGNLVGQMASRLQNMFARVGSRVSPLQIISSEGALQARRQLKYDSHETRMLLLPFVIWSALVVTIYIAAVTKMSGIVEVLAVHSVVNFIAARTYRAVFFCQELAAVADPGLLPASRAAVAAVWKVVRDAWFTLQLGEDAYKAAGPNTERFPLVKAGLASSSPQLAYIFYGNSQCHRVLASRPCPGPEYRFYHVIHAGLDSIMHQFMMYVDAMATSKSSVPPNLGDGDLDFIYNVGTKDLMDGMVEIQEAHLRIVMSLFNNLMVLHVILLILFWAIFGSFLIFLLNPLLRRISRERRRVAELMSQLPLELDVERLMARALGDVENSGGTPSVGASGGSRGPGSGPAALSSPPGGGEMAMNGFTVDVTADAVTKWKSIIRAASVLKGPNGGSIHSRRGSTTAM